MGDCMMGLAACGRLACRHLALAHHHLYAPYAYLYPSDPQTFGGLNVCLWRSGAMGMRLPGMTARLEVDYKKVRPHEP